jgi:hypothetical protein
MAIGSFDIDATPTKRIYLNIIADYDLPTAICELIDNALDAKSRDAVTVNVQVDTDQQSIKVVDQSGGVPEDELRKLVTPGESSMTGEDPTIGIFGVGSKRSVIALAQHVRIRTRYKNLQTFRIEYDDEWIRKENDWILQCNVVENIDPSSTIVELSQLRFRIDPVDVDALKDRLETIYGFFLRDQKIQLTVNTQALAGILFDQWAYPPDYLPQEFVKWLTPTDGGKKIRFQINAGLSREGGSIGGEWGVYVYCNKRLVARALRSPEVGFTTGLAGVPHPRMSLARIIVQFDGPSKDMPWTSNKSALNYNQQIFRVVKDDIIQVVKTFTAVSKALQADFESEVAPYTTGQIQRTKLDEETPIKPSLMPKVPKQKVNFRDEALRLNQELAGRKPWVRGLYESVIAFEILGGQRRLRQRNRILLVILDSTLEIAFKEYLAYEMPQPLGDEKLTQLFKNRLDVHKEVEKFILPNDPIWKKVTYFYRLRCDLIHRRAGLTVTDEEIDDFRKITTKLLHEGFGIRFPESEFSSH